MKSPSWHFLFAEAYDDWAADRAREYGTVEMLASCDDKSIAAAIGSADALLVRTYARVTAKVLEHAKRLKVIGRAGVGTENIDLAEAARRGIAVVYTPAAATEAVADLTIGLMLALVRDIPALDRAVRAGSGGSTTGPLGADPCHPRGDAATVFRNARQSALAQEMNALTLGIVGMGRIGRAVGRRGHHGFGMPVLYNDIVPVASLDFPATAVSKERLFAESDVVSLHLPLDESTRGLICRETLAQFKSSAFLVNTARGAIVDGAALAEALREGRLAGAAIDVFDPEPLPPDHPLFSAPRTIFTPHIGARTVLGQRRMNAVIDDVIRVLTGEPPRFPA